MYNLERFYPILFENIFDHLDLHYGNFDDFGATAVNHFAVLSDTNKKNLGAGVALYDQEPIMPDNSVAQIYEHFSKFNEWTDTVIFANSEISEYKDQVLQSIRDSGGNIHDCYYFFHGFAALSWFNVYRYSYSQKTAERTTTQPSKVFLAHNNLFTGDRSYRLAFVAKLIEKNLTEKGILSLPLTCKGRSWKEEVLDKGNRLTNDQRVIIFKQLVSRKEPFIADRDPVGFLGASMNFNLQKDVHWNIVPETVFYDKKLHLTEKTFKPIVAKKPFILLGAVNNLAYLKRYGFKTFSDFIDESYDDIEDNPARLDAVVSEIDKLCSLSSVELNDITMSVNPIVEHNYQWFWNDFRHIITDELIINLKNVLNDLDISHKHINWRNVAKLVSGLG